MKRFVIPLVVVGLFLVFVGFRVSRSEGEAIVYRFDRVQSGPIISTVSASGTLEPETSAFVASEVAGQVVELLADVNQHVKAGDVLARLDPDFAQARLESARAELEVARQAIEIARGQVDRAQHQADNARAMQTSVEADVKRAEVTAVDAGRDVTRKRKLMATGDVPRADTEHSAAEYDSANAGVAAAKARAAASVDAFAAAQDDFRVAQAQLKNTEATVAVREAAVRQAQLDLDHSSLRSPIDGVVVERHAVVGQTVSAATAAAPLFVIAGDLQNLRLHVNVAEADIGRLAVGQPATFVLDAFPGETFTGHVAEIWPQPESVQNVLVYEVMLSTDEVDRKLLPGMSADVRITVGRRDDVLAVPNAALRFRPAKLPSELTKSAGSEVWRLGRNGKPYPVAVRTGLSDGVVTEVEPVDGNLAKGDDVVVAAAQPASASARVGPLKF